MIKTKRTNTALLYVSQYGCVGNRIPTSRLRLVAARLLSNYYISLDSFTLGEPNGESPERDMRDQTTTNSASLQTPKVLRSTVLMSLTPQSYNDAN